MKDSTSVAPWILFGALALPLLALSSPLLEVDDARYAEVPRAMAASGDWVLPSLNAMPYVEKPPLWYWAAAASEKIFGPSEASARLPLMLLALLGALGVWWLGSWLYDAGTGRAAAAATASSALWIFLSHDMTLDMPVSVFLLWTTAFALRAMLRPEDAKWAAPAAWAAAALAFLSKGLIALLLPGLWAAALALLLPELRRGARRLISPLGLLIFLAACSPWFILMQRRRPDFLHTFFIEQHFQRYLTPKYNRGAPWWFYFAVLPAGLLPWSVPALAGLAKTARRPRMDVRAAALAAWVLGVAAFFSSSSSKLATYILPAVPHACLLAAVALKEDLPSWAKTLQRALGGILLLGAILAAAAFALGLLPHKAWPPVGLSSPDAKILSVLIVLLPACLGAAMLGSLSSKQSTSILAGGGTLAGLCLFLGLKTAAPILSAKEAALAVRAEARAEDQLWTYGTYLHGLPFYSGRLVDKLVYFVGEFHYDKRDPAFAGRFGDDDDIRALPRAGGRTFVILRSFERPHFIETISGKEKSISSWREFGRWSLAEVRAGGISPKMTK